MIALSVEDLSFSFGTKDALQNVSFRIEKGVFCALLGPNGAGKSTLFELLIRLKSVMPGQIEIAGHDLCIAPKAALSRVGIVFQQPTFDWDTSVWSNMTYFAALHGLRGRRSWDLIDAALDRLQLIDRKYEKVRTLNGGHRRRMEIARALIHQPEVLLLDEPTVGLDMETRAAINQHVHNLCENGTTVLWATHLVDEISPSDRLLILNEGQLLCDCIAAELDPLRSLSDAYLHLIHQTEGAN